MTVEDELLYFAYGSNLHVDQMRARCPSCELVSPAVLPEHRLSFFGASRRWDGAGVATIEFAPKSQVPGALYRLTPDDFDRLDGFEGSYVRARVEVRTRYASVRASTYRGRSPCAVRRPSSRYVAAVARGYAHHGHTLSTLLEAVRAVGGPA